MDHKKINTKNNYTNTKNVKDLTYLYVKYVSFYILVIFQIYSITVSCNVFIIFIVRKLIGRLTLSSYLTIHL